LARTEKEKKKMVQDTLFKNSYSPETFNMINCKQSHSKQDEQETKSMLNLLVLEKKPNSLLNSSSVVKSSFLNEKFGKKTIKNNDPNHNNKYLNSGVYLLKFSECKNGT
jgi:hypothetical protein